MVELEPNPIYRAGLFAERAIRLMQFAILLAIAAVIYLLLNN
jgi:hypothetical protein